MYYHLEFNIIQEHEITSGCGYMCMQLQEKKGEGANVPEDNAKGQVLKKKKKKTSSKNNLDDATNTELGINFPNEIASFGCMSHYFLVINTVGQISTSAY